MIRRIPGLYGLALAGGGARRLGGVDKPLLEVGGRPMLARVLAVLAAEAEAVAISANGDPSRFAAFGVPVLPDGAFAGQGPLAGVLAGLEWAAEGGAEVLLTVPGDSPLAPPGLAAALTPAPACAASAGRAHFLVALWPVSLRNELRGVLSIAGTRRVGGFADRIGMRRVDITLAPGYSFLNVNTPEDLAGAREAALIDQARGCAC